MHRQSSVPIGSILYRYQTSPSGGGGGCGGCGYGYGHCSSRNNASDSWLQYEHVKTAVVETGDVGRRTSDIGHRRRMHQASIAIKWEFSDPERLRASHSRLSFSRL
ncbi:hypothetical protein SODALDRAFT_355999 [Sodiomyces alkalinus F11]|uniref:Uncharacterized protein n=1 Tax=Sodiomyces alkalinus (strain CBS 110278 / VKM F-3762 / F11) TaxID=1314773 RepID=A0A3N2QAN6_SODAK|nr:hypothetical protein SODALDRAFT_355999 [Sodiomyces alkalinus F11]ROT43777.1 hypothetical protein SODALDRAFT_355999 [Sodiomyces alkalinus F11]